MLCELVRYLEVTMCERPDGTKPRLSVIVSAWDLVDHETLEQGPVAYLEKEYPLFAGRLDDCSAIEIKIFGLSIVGGDLKYDLAFRDQFLDSVFDENGWVAIRNTDTGLWEKQPDITLPVSWLVESVSE